MRPRLLLDTHALIRLIREPRRLSAEQRRVLRAAEGRQEPLAISPISLLEIAVLHSENRVRLGRPLKEFFELIRAGHELEVLPVTQEIAEEVAFLTALKDPADKAIVATARVHGLQLVTSDQRIIESQLVRTIE